MAHHKSAEKRMRTSTRRRARNRMYKSKLKTIIKDLRNTTEGDAAAELYKKVSALLDRYALKGVIHANTAANKKSKLARFVQNLG